jgi:hypothetical protein
MRRLVNQFKEKIYKDDLKNCILYGLLNMLLFSILAGAVQFFANAYLGIGFGLLVYLIAYMIGKEVRDRIYSYHILYSILSVVFFVIGYFIYNISYYAFLTHNVLLALQTIFSANGMINIVFSFLNYRTYLIPMAALYNVLDILIIVFSIITAYRLPQSRK